MAMNNIEEYVVGESVGVGWVELLPSLRGFSKRVKAGLVKEMRGVDVSIPVTLEPKVGRGGLLAGLKPLKVPVDLVPRGGVGALESLTQRVKIVPDETDFRSRMTRLLRGGTSRVTQNVKVDTDVDKDRVQRSLLGLAGSAGGAMAGVGSSLASSLVSSFGSTLSNPVTGIVATVAAALATVVVGPVAAVLTSTAASAMTLAGGGLGLIFLGAFGLRKDAEIQKAVGGLFDGINKTLAEAAQPLKGPFLQAIEIIGGALKGIGPDLKGMFTTIAPFVTELARGFAGFLKSFSETGAFDKFAKAAGPVLQQVANALPDIGNALSQFMISIAGKGPQAADFMGKFLRFTADAIRFIGGAIGWLTDKFFFLVNVATTVWHFLQKVWDFAKLVGNAFAIGGALLVGDFSSAKKWMGEWVADFKKWWSGIPVSVGAALGALKGKVVGALSTAGTWLYNAGKSILQGLIDGIKAKFGALGDIAGQVAGIINDYLRGNSPTRKGPLSGSGWTYHSGEVIAGDLAKGMEAELPTVASAGNQLAAAVGSGTSARSSGSVAAGFTIDTAGARLDQLLLEVLKESIRERNGGNVQLAIGS